MSVFVDTSAFYALLVASDVNHQAASIAWSTLRMRCEPLITSNYVLVEMSALVQRRLGMVALRELHSAFLPC